LLAQKPDLKVIYTSGYNLEIAQQDFALHEGCNFLQKPYNLSALAKIVHDCLAGQCAEVGAA